VLLGRPDGEPIAELWRNMLEQRGIYSLTRNVSAPAHIRMADRFEVYVLQRDLEDARDLLCLDADSEG
jgi:hypothetical protein